MESQVSAVKGLSSFNPPNSLDGNVGLGQSSKLKDTVQQFEAFFIQSMLKSMRSASLASGLLESDNSDFYQDWHDQQLAGDIATNESFGISKLLHQQFGGEPYKPTTVASLTSTPIFDRSSHSQIGKSINSSNTTLKQLVTEEITAVAIRPNAVTPSTPEQFVENVYQHAQQAAKKLNTSADVLVAIAALETGWGLHTPKTSIDQDSFNYFGIKANDSDRSAAVNATKEFDGKNMIEIQDGFRTYSSPAESFNDFAELLLNSSRYQEALNSSGDAKAFVNELQKAGYATDPNYAKKIGSILNGSILKDAINSQQSSKLIANKVTNLETTQAH